MTPATMVPRSPIDHPAVSVADVDAYVLYRTYRELAISET